MLPFITYFKLSNIFADVTVEEVKAEILAHAAEFNFNRKTLEDTNTTEDTTISNITFHKYSVYDFPPSNKNDIIHYYLEQTNTYAYYYASANGSAWTRTSINGTYSSNKYTSFEATTF
ncbi:hypothetical protein TVAG_240430 [Trichomonas vaginalis G3]|uniref:Uncharacterized protein n=1 Tax=Trichomonas vaginalis (strain ATCC PRA-98 / G3) TaxID=412133 RepID=A2EJ90_TRIV3|nr:hypothetical protein TVAG_240430 [Trichomonas vaginalis G3]|eukprot:XP_001319465.1 hypothetical protein [Trichomonas vaginalis G3]